MLGSQLGIGAYRGVVEKGLDGHMVSVTGQLDLCYVPFSELINKDTMLTEVSFVEPGSGDLAGLVYDWQVTASNGQGVAPGGASSTTS